MYEDYRPVVKSVGHGTTTKADLTSNEEVWITILELSQDIGHRLKKLGMNCMGISICIRNEDLMHKEWQQKLNFATQSPFVIAKLAYTLFLQKYVWNKNIRCVAKDDWGFGDVGVIDDSIVFVQRKLAFKEGALNVFNVGDSENKVYKMSRHKISGKYVGRALMTVNQFE